MAIKHRIPITNGIGSLEVVNGRYNVTAEVPGYDNSTLTPKSIEIVDGVETYAFTISATGTLTINVTDTGSSTTGIMALELGRKFIGIDLEKEYLDLSVKRFEQKFSNKELKWQ